jgi:hypothetical protein
MEGKRAAEEVDIYGPGIGLEALDPEQGVF